jgi:hypothetical protein
MVSLLLPLLSLVPLVFSDTQHPLVSPAAETGGDPYLFPTSQHHTFISPIKSVAVIGAGPSGLQHVAALLENGFQVRLFERDSVPGGNWRYTEEIPVDVAYPLALLPLPVLLVALMYSRT